MACVGIAFTLVETVVVIAVVSVLIGLVVPVLGSAREASRATSCRSNLRSLGAAVASYALNHKDLLPLATKVADVREDRLSPFDVLAAELDVQPPSMRDGAVRTAAPFLCPSDTSIGPRLGVSYRYAPADFMGIPHIWGARAQFYVSKMYEIGPSDYPILADMDRFHGRADRRDSSQVVLYSQAVRRQPME